MTDQQIAQLAASRQRWKLAALTTWVILAITVFFMGIFVVYASLELRRHEMQAALSAGARLAHCECEPIRTRIRMMIKIRSRDRWVEGQFELFIDFCFHAGNLAVPPQTSYVAWVKKV